MSNYTITISCGSEANTGLENVVKEAMPAPHSTSYNQKPASSSIQNTAKAAIPQLRVHMGKALHGSNTHMAPVNNTAKNARLNKVKGNTKQLSNACAYSTQSNTVKNHPVKKNTGNNNIRSDIAQSNHNVKSYPKHTTTTPIITPPTSPTPPAPATDTKETACSLGLLKQYITDAAKQEPCFKSLVRALLFEQITEQLPALQVKNRGCWQPSKAVHRTVFHFALEFEYTMQAFGLNAEQHWKRYLPLCMDASQKSWFKSKLESQNCTWKEVVCMLRDLLVPPQDTYQGCYNFIHNTKQQQNERLIDFMARWREGYVSSGIYYAAAGSDYEAGLANAFVKAMLPVHQAKLGELLQRRGLKSIPPNIEDTLELLAALDLQVNDQRHSNEPPNKRPRRS
ncbi:hypothetical protein O0I10_003627 [Lichtheimia ornata]|uniref:Uncharacterized protein n=1 Tax=Lichtheimia ornata TaxID=688661 RepID=A0AAD7V7Z9_9FUNG|nr:uncharacterized protein O0I10_003627 [Lichtheimia ornata]KAJ8660580.1 hypothetical protein O0I10_003627 [Lichtheimia ornata]